MTEVSVNNYIFLVYLGLFGAPFFCPLRHTQNSSPYSVAISLTCRNNFDKNQANFLGFVILCHFFCCLRIICTFFFKSGEGLYPFDQMMQMINVITHLGTIITKSQLPVEPTIRILP